MRLKKYLNTIKLSYFSTTNLINLISLISFIFVICLGIIIVSYNILIPVKVYAQTLDELKQKIDARNALISQLEQEINQYKTELSKTSAQAQTLKTTITSLDINSKKLGADLQVTSQKINSTSLQIQQLGLQIGVKESSIQKNKQALGETMRHLNEADSHSFFESLLDHTNVAIFWNDVATIQEFQNSVKNHVGDLKGLRQDLLVNKSQTEEKKAQLVNLEQQLTDQKALVEIDKAQKAKLLATTKNKESNYKQIIADKITKKKAFEQELLDFESQLRFAVDPTSIPSSRPGILSWPLDDHVITQYFGDTDFSRTHAQAYNGHGHNGIDLGAPIGTPIKAALTGIVTATGDTDTICPRASYGKWVLIKHANGLSTLYAHLSLIKAAEGQQVATGDVIGYSGMTGYATGPHLHFTVYATQGVRVLDRQSKVCGGTYTMPIADLKAYLNPLLYL